MKNKLIIGFYLIPILSFSQVPIFQTINSGGGTATGTNHFVTYSIGDNVISTIRGNERIVTQGFQQPNFNITNVTDVKEAPQAALIKAFPNPVSDELIIDYPSAEFKNLSLELYDIQGKCLSILTLPNGSNQATLAFHQYISGEYLLVFKELGKIIKTIKIVKQY